MKKIFLILFTVVGLFSCSESFLDKTPTNKIADTEVFISAERVDAAMLGAYDKFSAYQAFGLYPTLFGDVMGDDALVKSIGNYGWFVETYSYTFTDNSYLAKKTWQNMYEVIDNANNIISGVVNTPVSDELKDEYRAEAKVLRAISYLHLVRLFGETSYSVGSDARGVILITKPAAADDADMGRSTVKEAYDLIVSDLLLNLTFV